MLQIKAVSFLAYALALLGQSQTAVADKKNKSLSYYPAPFGGWVDEWKESYAKAKKLVDSMTLAEKTNITAGSGIFMGERCNGNTGSALRLGFPQLCLQDGASGVSLADNVTSFPAGITTGATFDKELMYQRGVAMGIEARGKGVNVLLGPTVGPIGRKPKGGRNWEGFGIDPVLQAVGARQTIKGIQEQGVIATVKHLIGNEQEMYRQYTFLQKAYTANIDDRTLHEFYLWPFAEAVHAGVGAVMTAYNAVNGTACSQNSNLINGILKDELGFQGFVMSDWLAHMSGVESALAGLDMDMPGDTQIPLLGYSYWMYELTRSTLNGSVPMDRLNDMATRIVASWYQMGQDQSFPATNFHYNTRDRKGPMHPAAWPYVPKVLVNEKIDVRADHDVIARQIAQDAITMLKNEDKLLPLSEMQPIVVFGSDAAKNPDNINKCLLKSCDKGTLTQGWGSGTVELTYVDDPTTALQARAQNVSLHLHDHIPKPLPHGGPDDVAIVFINSDSGENTFTVENNHGDRDASGLYAWHDGDKLVQDVAKKFDNVVVVAHTVGPMILEKWINLKQVKSVLIAHLPGQEAGRSLVEVLYGDVSPNGHLPYSITKSEKDMPKGVTDLIDFAFTNQPKDKYDEGIFVDYRWLNKGEVKPRYAFGHGLSYTQFNFTDATVTKVTNLTTTPPSRSQKSGILNYSQHIPSAKEAIMPEGFSKVYRFIYSWLTEQEANDAVQSSLTKSYQYPSDYSFEQKPGPRSGGGQGGNPALWDVAYNISVIVSNLGDKYAGKASVQAYLEFPWNASYETPVVQLRDFVKTKTLAPGESQVVMLQLTRKDLSVWDTTLQDWYVPVVDGGYKVWIGEAMDNAHLMCRLDSGSCRGGITRHSWVEEA